LNNTIVYNTASASGAGIYAENSGAAVVNSIIWGNTPDSVGTDEKESGLSITYSCVEGGWFGEGGEGVIIDDPGFEDPDGGWFILATDSACIDIGDSYSRLDMKDELTEDAVYPAQGEADTDMGAYGGTGELPAEVIGGEVGDEVPETLGAKRTPYIVAEDIIVPVGKQLIIEPGVELKFHNRSGLMVFGVLEADGKAGEIKFTNWEEWDTGAGIRFHYGSSGNLSFCQIDHMENIFGGGISCSDSSPAIAHCTITENSADVGGGIFCLRSEATITNCTILKNSADGGGGIDCLNSSPTITNCTISGNGAFGSWGEGGGLHIQETSSPVITNCMIFKNSAGEEGGGISCLNDSSPAITHCTISDNIASFGGGIRSDNSSPRITNCILWANSAPDGPEIYVPSGSPVVTYSDVQGGESGVYLGPESDLNWLTGNIDEDPRFVGGGDYHLTSSSPCIDAGTDAGVCKDMDGECRPQGAGFDMGADEYIDPYCLDDSDEDCYYDIDCGGSDCDDTNPYINPCADEICDDEVDNDCDDLIDYDPLDPDCCTDLDGDGSFVEGGLCGPIDCNDSDPDVNPDAPEGPVINCDGIDNDCDGEIDEGFTDADGDDWACCESEEGCEVDCNDDDPAIHPLALDPCDGTDQNCDGTDGVLEICGNGIDDDCDGFVDGEDDKDCQIWEKYPGNPVLDLGPPGAWDAVLVASPSVLFDGTEYKMWYAGSDDGKHFRIGYATSADGIVWNKYAGNPVLDLGPTGSWDQYVVGLPYVLLDGAEYKMWYTGSYDESPSSRTGYATSADGIMWNKYDGNPVLDVGPAESWDEVQVHGPSVLLDGNEYKMWFGGTDVSLNFRIGYATSADGIVWNKYAGNPVLDLGSDEAWDKDWVYTPRVLFDGKEYKAWFSGRDRPFDTIGYAASADGIEWNKFARNPVLERGPKGTWDYKWANAPSVLFDFDCNAYKMWYAGLDIFNLRIGYAIFLPGGRDLDGDDSYDEAGEPCGGWDCNDSDSEIHPGATEICDGKDNDCDGQIDEGFTDADGDGWAYCLDCCDDPSDPCCPVSYPNPYNPEVCDGCDNTCDGWMPELEFDDDGDGYVECPAWVGDPGLQGGDCDDEDPATYPGAPEQIDSTKDNNCDGKIPFDEEERSEGEHCGCAQYRAPARSGLAAAAMVWLVPAVFIGILKSRVRREKKRA